MYKCGEFLHNGTGPILSSFEGLEKFYIGGTTLLGHLGGGLVFAV